MLKKTSIHFPCVHIKCAKQVEKKIISREFIIILIYLIFRYTSAKILECFFFNFNSKYGIIDKQNFVQVLKHIIRMVNYL